MPRTPSSKSVCISQHGSSADTLSRDGQGAGTARASEGHELMGMALLAVKALSEWLEVRPSTIYLWAEQGVIPHFKLGRLLRFDAEEIATWLQHQRRAVSHDPPRRRRPQGIEPVDLLIAEAKRDLYTPGRGKPDQDRATGKG
jgi:excisionase family DNA binding protein